MRKDRPYQGTISCIYVHIIFFDIHIVFIHPYHGRKLIVLRVNFNFYMSCDNLLGHEIKMAYFSLSVDLS